METEGRGFELGKGEKKDDEELSKVTGLLAVFVKSLQLFDEDAQSTMLELLQLRAGFGDLTKHFPLSKSGETETGHVVCCKTRHFPVQIPKKKDSHKNLLILEVYMKSPLVNTYETVLGGVAVHLHDIITTSQGSPLVQDLELKEENSGQLYARISVEFAFTYGMYGFGESHQLRQPVHRLTHHLCCSMLPRITPPDARADHNSVLLPHPQAPPQFIPFTRERSRSTRSMHNDGDHPLPQLLMSKMTRLHSLHRELQNQKGRHQRLKFLENLVHRTLPATTSHLPEELLSP